MDLCSAFSFAASSPAASAAALATFNACVARHRQHPANETPWRPAAGTTWQILLDAPLAIDPQAPAMTPDVEVYDVDLFENPASTFAALRALGKRVVCYFSAGSYEDGRPDSGDFDTGKGGDLGSELEGWPGEYWLDTNSEAVRGVMRRRIELAREKGCDGVDPDNVDGFRGFVAAHAAITTFPDEKDGDVVRLDFEHPHDAWAVGQHFYLCFTESSIFQSHPFTPLNAAVTVNGRTKHSYVFRAKGGETKKIAQIAAKKLAAAATASTTTSEDKDGVITAASAPTTPVVLTGPYGDPIMRNITPEANILCVAGGTGITYVLPALLSLTANPASPRKLELIWVVRHAKDVDWVKPELAALEALDVTVRIFATRDAASSSSDADRSSEAEADEEKRAAGAVAVQKMRARGAAASVRSGGIGHPDLALLVREFVQATVAARTVVFASGPGGLMTDARAAVAVCNDGSKVWKGDERFHVDLIHDERMER
ncbi:hypothetical protein BN1723_001394 [Verticillium longisporum]|uniref:alpha-galactosidase n=1 Tax=Verticillium longisporum TaxID=100787 RepID=A0A0G4NNS7_VERLO|nr:hypothetical protein BN1723_001394 [Verticillium longisporum]